jgi:type III secretion protein C
MNPKITVEHNVPAEIFVGSQIPIKGESIANASIGSTSSVVATNYVMQEIGISLKVTPLISSYKTVTLIIEQKLSSASATQVAQQGQTTAPPATVNEERTITRVHLPTDHFLVMSGAIQDQTILTDSRTPCLGGIPLIGALFGVTEKDYNKRNLMVFIRPIIIDTEEDIDEVTRHQEEILKAKSTIEKGWNRQCDDAKTLLNIGY